MMAGINTHASAGVEGAVVAHGLPTRSSLLSDVAPRMDRR
jgi:hypothetical protein